MKMNTHSFVARLEYTVVVARTRDCTEEEVALPGSEPENVTLPESEPENDSPDDAGNGAVVAVAVVAGIIVLVATYCLCSDRKDGTNSEEDEKEDDKAKDDDQDASAQAGQKQADRRASLERRLAEVRKQQEEVLSSATSTS